MLSRVNEHILPKVPDDNRRFIIKQSSINSGVAARYVGIILHLLGGNTGPVAPLWHGFEAPYYQRAVPGYEVIRTRFEISSELPRVGTGANGCIRLAINHGPIAERG